MVPGTRQPGDVRLAGVRLGLMGRGRLKRNERRKGDDKEKLVV